MNKVIEKYFSSKAILSRFTILIMDLLIVVFSSTLTIFLRFDLYLFNEEITTYFFNRTLVLVVINLLFFILFKTFSGVLRFSTFTDLLRIIYALTCGYVLAYIVLKISFLASVITVPISNALFFSTYVANVLIMIFSRIVVKEMYETITKQKKKAENVFVYGTKEAGMGIAKSLNSNSDLNYLPIGFITDEQAMIGKVLIGLRVYKNDDFLFRVMADKNISKIIVSPQKMIEIQNSRQLDRFLEHNITLLTTPPIDEWNKGDKSKVQLKEIQIEDLLPRDPIKINMKEIAGNIEGKRVMVTGAAGSIGSEIVRQVAAFNPYCIILIDQAETPLHAMRLEMKNNWREVNTKTIIADVVNETRMERIFNEHKPQYIFHAAAYKHVPMMEDDVSESIQTNVRGTKTIADLAVKYKAQKFVMISTDKAVNPTNIMGCSKRICEIYVQAYAKYLQNTNQNSTQFITTRFGNVLGSNGSVIPLFREQIRKGGPVTVTHPEIIRYFMTIPEACQLVLEAGAMGKGGEIYIFDMGEPVKIFDLAKKMIKLSGVPNVRIEFTGLRHGEKLYEELLNMEEYTKPTHHEKIMIADVRVYEYDEVKQQIQNLIDSSYKYDEMDSVRKMKEIVPEFKSKNSPFEVVDEMIANDKNTFLLKNN